MTEATVLESSPLLGIVRFHEGGIHPAAAAR